MVAMYRIMTANERENFQTAELEINRSRQMTSIDDGQK